MFVIVVLFLAVVAAYFILGTPLMEYIHGFVQQFTHSFPVVVFFLPHARRRKGGS